MIGMPVALSSAFMHSVLAAAVSQLAWAAAVALVALAAVAALAWLAHRSEGRAETAELARVNPASRLPMSPI